MKLVLAVVVAAVLVAGGLIAFSLVSDDDLGAQAEEIVESPEELYGERVEVRGALRSFYRGAFTIGDDLPGNDELLVVAGRGVSLPEAVRDRRDDVVVGVSGVVQRKDEGVELVPGERFEPFDGGPYVRADAVEPAGQ